MKITGRELSLQWDAQKGVYSICRGQTGEPLLANATAGVLLPDGALKLADMGQASVRESSSSEPLLGGAQLVASARDTSRGLKLAFEATVLAERPGVVLSVSATNTSSAPVELCALEPLAGVAGAGAESHFPSSRLLTNGRMYHDPGRVLAFPGGGEPAVDSWWDAAFHCPSTSETLVAGFLDNEEGEGHIRAAETSAAAFHVSARSVLNSRVLLPPGATHNSGRVLVLLKPDGFSGLEEYATLCAKLHRVRLNPVLNAWCSWFITYGGVSEEEVMKHAEFIARELKPYGMDWVQIDDGFQRSFGDWEGKSERFPKGMKGAADKIRALGLKPGLWIAPFAISDASPVAREHPEYLVRDASGAPQLVEEAHRGQAQRILDVSNPQAREWLRQLLHTITEQWGYDLIKTDFSEWTLLAAAQFHDPSFSTAKAYHDGVAAIREGMGPERHMLDCGPALCALGLIDSMRIELDRPVPENPLWDQYTGFYNSTGPAVAKRYYLHGRTWINDADHIRLAGLSIPEGQAAATITALSGGNMMSGDRLYALDAERLSILKRVFPAYGQAARPLDLYQSDSAELFHLPIDQAGRSWHVLGCFNWGNAPRQCTVDLKPLGWATGKKWIGYEFWSQQPVKVSADGSVSLAQLPHSVALLAIHEDAGRPQLIGTDRHFTQGAVELRDVRWSESEKTLSGMALGAPAMSWSAAVHVPENWTPADAAGAEIDSSTLPDRLLRLKLRFDGAEQKWSVRFR